MFKSISVLFSREWNTFIKMIFCFVIMMLFPSVSSTSYKYMTKHDIKLESGIMQSVHTNTFIECLSQCSWNVSCGSVSFHSQFGECMLSNESFSMYDDVKSPRILPGVTWLSGIKLQYGGLFIRWPQFIIHFILLIIFPVP